jgi:hypothetical protein
LQEAAHTTYNREHTTQKTFFDILEEVIKREDNSREVV